MTQEEKARAYDEALERAKKALKTDIHESGVWAIQRIFPQLRESEDESIRKWIISYIRKSVFTEGEYPIALDAIAWLEKQKEQKHPNGCFTCDEYKKGCEEGRRNGFTAGYNKAMKEVEQKEQKPWKVGANAYFTPEQKSAEWSEEDEDMLNSCISSIEEAKENRYAYKETDGDTSYDHEIAWLKLLRNRVGKEFLQPHWKPSEEQMRALLKVVDKARELHYSSNSGYDEYDVLRLLYKQLKEL